DGSAGIIRDAHVTLLGVVGGGQILVGNERGPLYVPPNGEALTLLDYWVDESALPDRNEEELAGPFVRVRKNYRVNWDRTGVSDRVVRVDGRRVGSAPGSPDGRVVPYEDARGDGTVVMSVSATISVWMDYTVLTINQSNGNVVDRDERTVRAARLTVRDSRPVDVRREETLTVEQQVVRIEGQPGNRLVVRIRGPNDLSDRALWRVLDLRGGTNVTNNWAPFSRTQYSHGFVASDAGERREALPHVLQTVVTSSTARPQVNNSGRLIARLVSVFQSNITNTNPSLADGVNLTHHRPTLVSQLVLTGVPGRIERVVTVFGREIDPKTRGEVTVQESRLTVTRVGQDRARIRLFDPDTGEGIPGRTLSLNGASRQTAVTNDSGVVVVQTTGRVVGATFPGDDWTAGLLDPDRRYYQSASSSQVFVQLGRLGGEVVEIAFA
ncbi:MAG: hypothetical protein ABEI99_12500, partial [Halobaculum sp.]